MSTRATRKSQKVFKKRRYVSGTYKGQGPNANCHHKDNYLVDTASRVILSVEATPARFRQEVLAARRMREHVARFGVLSPESSFVMNPTPLPLSR